MNILVAIDGSSCSQSAIDAVLHQPWPAHTEMRLVSVLTGLESIWPFFDRHAHFQVDQAASGAEVGEAAELELGEAHNRTEEHLALVAAEISALKPGIIVSAEVRRGEVAEEIVNSAVEWQANLIVVGSHGRKGISRMLLGSVSQTVLLTAPMPVIIVKKFELDQRHEDGFSRILVALDGSNHSEAALHWIARQTWSHRAQFHLLHVYNHESIEYIQDGENQIKADGSAQRGSSLHALQARAAGLSEVLGLGHERFSCEVRGGAPAATIVSTAEKIKADLILMGSHGWHGLSRVLLGSVSQQVAEKAPCSVGIVPLVGTDEEHQEHSEGTIEMPEESSRRYDSSERPHVLPGGMI